MEPQISTIMFTKVSSRFTVFWAIWIHFLSSCLSLKFILILSLDPGIHTGLFLSHFPTIIWHIFHDSIRATCPGNLRFLDIMTLMIFGEEYNLWNSLLWHFLQCRVRSNSALCVQIFSSILTPGVLNIFQTALTPYYQFAGHGVINEYILLKHHGNL